MDFWLRDALKRDRYKDLGLGENATHEQIKDIVRKIVLEEHSDKKGNTEASEKYIQACEANAVIGVPWKRKIYDETRRNRAGLSRQESEPPVNLEEFIAEHEEKLKQFEKGRDEFKSLFEHQYEELRNRLKETGRYSNNVFHHTLNERNKIKNKFSDWDLSAKVVRSELKSVVGKKFPEAIIKSVKRRMLLLETELELFQTEWESFIGRCEREFNLKINKPEKESFKAASTMVGATILKTAHDAQVSGDAKTK